MWNGHRATHAILHCCTLEPSTMFACPNSHTLVYFHLFYGQTKLAEASILRLFTRAQQQQHIGPRCYLRRAVAEGILDWSHHLWIIFKLNINLLVVFSGVSNCPETPDSGTSSDGMLRTFGPAAHRAKKKDQLCSVTIWPFLFQCVRSFFHLFRAELVGCAKLRHTITAYAREKCVP